MYAYKFTLYSGQVFKSYSDTDNRVKYLESKYLQILGVSKTSRRDTIPFANLSPESSNFYRGYSLYILTCRGNPKRMASPIKKVEREKL